MDTARTFHCSECGARLYGFIVLGDVCSRCLFDLTGEDDQRPHPAEPWPEVGPEE